MNDYANTVDQVVDLICWHLIEGGHRPSVLKVHKLLFYVQAFHLAIEGGSLLPIEFRAWLYGPINVETFHRFKNMGKGQFCEIEASEIDYTVREKVSDELNYKVLRVLESYGDLSGTQLVQLSQSESPWIEARKGLKLYETGNQVISNESMKDFYSQLVVDA